MNIIIDSLVVGYLQFAQHVAHLQIEEIVEHSKDDYWEYSSEAGLVDWLLAGSEGWRSAEEVHPPYWVLNQVFESHFLKEII